MTALRDWLIFVGVLVSGVLLAMVILALAGRPDLAAVTGRLAVVLSAIGLAFAALMAGIIAWGEVRTARPLGTATSKTLHGHHTMTVGAVRRKTGEV